MVERVMANFTEITLITLPPRPVLGKNIEPDKTVLFERATSTFRTGVFLSMTAAQSFLGVYDWPLKEPTDPFAKDYTVFLLFAASIMLNSLNSGSL
jgi:hypothetical protein